MAIVDFERVRRRQHSCRRSRTATRADLEIVKDHMSDFYQWFYFRVAGAEGREVTLRITNCGGVGLSARLARLQSACVSIDREEWLRIDDTSYDDGVLTIRLTPASDCVWLAYFAPYSMERHHDLVDADRVASGVEYSLARQVARRPGHRLPDHRRRPAQRLALCPPASRARAWPNGGWKARSRS